MVLTVTEDTPADMLAGSMELLVQLPRDHHLHTQRVTVLRSTPMMDLLVQIATAHKLTASSYTLQAIGERGLVLPHHPNTPIGALDALQVKLLPKQVTCAPRKTKQTNQPFETTFRLQVHLPRNQLYVSRVSPKMNLGEILDEVCREKNLDRNKYELRHPANLEETLDLALCLQDYHLQEVTLYAKQTRSLGPTLSTQDIMALQRQEERRRQQTKQSVFGFMFKKSKENSVSTDSLGGRSVSPARSDETGRSASPLQPPARPQRKRRQAPKPPTDGVAGVQDTSEDNNSNKDKMTINHSRNSSDSSGYHEASVLSDNPDSAARLPETLPRRSKAPGMSDPPRKLAHTSQSSKSLSNLALTGAGTLSRGISSASLSSAGLRKKRAAPPPPAPRPLSSAISTQALERIVDSEESLTSDIDPSKPPSDIGAPSKASSDIDCPKANSDIGVSTKSMRQLDYESKQEKTTTCESDVNSQQKSAVKADVETCSKPVSVNHKLAKRDLEMSIPVEATSKVEQARVAAKRVGEPAPLPKPRKLSTGSSTSEPPTASKRKVAPPLPLPRVLNTEFNGTENLSRDNTDPEHTIKVPCIISISENMVSSDNGVVPLVNTEEINSKLKDECVTLDEDKLNREERASETISDSMVQDNTLLRSNLHVNDEKGNNIEVNPAKPISMEDPYLQCEAKSFNEDEPNRQEKISEIVSDINNKSSNANQQLDHGHDRNSELGSDSIELNVSSEGSLSLECEITSESKDNNFSEQDRALNTKYDDSHDQTENPLNNLYASLDGGHSPNESCMKPDRVTEQRNEQLEILHQQTVCQRPPRMLKKTACAYKGAENIESAKHVHSEDTTNGMTVKSDVEENRKVCTVISTIPKCERLDDIKEDSVLNNTVNRDIVVTDQQFNRHSPINCTTERVDESPVQNHSTLNEQNAEIKGSINNIGKNVKRSKRIFRSQSDSLSNDYETDLLMKQRRYLTSHSNNIVYALNFNLSALNSGSLNTTEIGREQTPVGHDTKPARDLDVDKGESYGNFATVNEDTPSETDILLQKVSDTLSSALPTSSSPVSSDSTDTNCGTAISIQLNAIDSSTKSETTVIEMKKESNKVSKPCADFPIESTLDSSTPNITVGSQQDTSDYVSAMSEDLSISDWEYQLPAPPSAFRDTHSPTINGYDTITLRSVEAFKEPLVNPVLEPVDTTDSSYEKNAEPGRNILNNSEMHLEPVGAAGSHNRNVKPVRNVSSSSEVELERNEKPSNKKTNFVSEAEINIKRVTAKPIVKQTSMVCHKSEDNLNLRKEIISELETKIETGTLPQSINKEFDRRVMDSEISAPQIAPVDNTLSNFTITTYAKQKSLDIYDEIEQPDHYTRNSNEKFIKSFATLSRNITTPANYDNKNTTKNVHLTNGISYDKKATNKLDDLNANNTEFNQVRPKIHNQDGSLHRWQTSNATNEKTNIQRSKSHISMSSNMKYQTNGNNEKKYEELHDETDNSQMKKARSITNLNIDVGRTNEKFSQWRDNILKRQEEPTKEKQLQSLQVLKSILPQLKNAQQTEENVSKEYSNAILIEKKYEAASNEHSNKTNVVSTRESRESSNKQLSREESTKRYTYAGPPAINLGSWSERPSVNVQIKMDTDYKLGMNNVSGNRTVVNINSMNDEKHTMNYTRDIVRDDIVKKENKIDSSVNKNTDELAKKLITHTTALCFKKPLLSKINVPDSMKSEDKPIVTGVELKKTFVQMREMPKNNENEIDTTPVNFRELTKTFGQHLPFKPKSKRVNVNRHSVDLHDLQSNDIGEITEPSVKQNGYAKFIKMSNQNDCTLKSQPLTNGIQQNSRTKRFTSIVGIYPTDEDNGSQNDISLRNNVNNTKINPPMPIVKGFKISTSDSKKNNNQINHNGLSITDDSRKDIQPPKPPTMPVITGVTLKNTRPKSMPVQIDPRNTLLESIRNFGGREKLKNVAERY